MHASSCVGMHVFAYAQACLCREMERSTEREEIETETGKKGGERGFVWVTQADQPLFQSMLLVTGNDTTAQ